MTSGVMKETEQFSEDYLRSIDIHELLPQQEPFVMIGCLTHFDMIRTVTETKIKDNNIFVEKSLFSASGLIENIAQTCAARIGFVNKFILLKEEIQIGFIGAIKDLKIYSNPKVGDVITTVVDVQDEILGMILAKAKITSGDNLLAETDMKIAIKKG